MHKDDPATTLPAAAAAAPAAKQPMECPMPQVDDLSRSLATFDQDSTVVAVIEMSLKTWLVAGIVPGVSRAPLKKLAADEEGVVRLLLISP